MRKVTHAKVPNATDWAGYESDLDVRNAHKLLFGKSLEEVQRHFGGTKSISRGDELLYMPRRPYQYYIFAFAEFLMSDRAREDPDSASSFLRFCLAREKRDPGSVAQIYSRLEPAIRYVASHQKYYDANPDIYGNFEEIASEIAALCKT